MREKERKSEGKERNKQGERRRQRKEERERSSDHYNVWRVSKAAVVSLLSVAR